jgi:hypothetical protein
VIDSARACLRALVRAPQFAVTAGLILALGIGLSTAVFTVSDALLLCKLPVRDQDRIVTLWGEKRDGSVSNWPLDLRDTRAFARRARTLEEVGYTAYEGAWPVAIRVGDELTRLYGVAPTDIKTLIVVAMALLVIAVAATFGPARAGASVDPAAALRSGDYP